MKIKTLLYTLAATSMLMSAPAHAADHYTLDKDHTHIAFLVGHLGFSQMLGTFSDFTGTFDLDEKNPGLSRVDITVKTASVHTSSTTLDEHLKGDKFFNTEKFPEAHFVSTEVKLKGEHDAEVFGNLTMLGVTKPLVLIVHLNKADYHPMTNLYTAGFDIRALLKRSDFGMDAYVPMVADDVKLAISVEGTNQTRKKDESINKQPAAKN